MGTASDHPRACQCSRQHRGGRTDPAYSSPSPQHPATIPVSPPTVSFRSVFLSLFHGFQQLCTTGYGSFHFLLISSIPTRGVEASGSPSHAHWMRIAQALIMPSCGFVTIRRAPEYRSGMPVHPAGYAPAS
jgi:hypothetical protein